MAAPDDFQQFEVFKRLCDILERNTDAVSEQNAAFGVRQNKLLWAGGICSVLLLTGMVFCTLCIVFVQQRNFEYLAKQVNARADMTDENVRQINMNQHVTIDKEGERRTFDDNVRDVLRKEGKID